MGVNPAPDVLEALPPGPTKFVTSPRACALTSVAAWTSRLTASRWNAVTRNGMGSLYAPLSGVVGEGGLRPGPGPSVRLFFPEKVSRRFEPGTRAAPESTTPTYAAEKVTGPWPIVFSIFTRT